MREFYLRSKADSFTGNPANRDADATMIFWKNCTIPTDECPVVAYFRQTHADMHIDSNKYCFNIQPDVSIDLIRKYNQTAQYMCMACQPNVKHL